MPRDFGLNLLVVTPSFAPREDSESLVNTKIVTALRAKDICVDVLSRRTAPAGDPTEATPHHSLPRYHVPFKRLRDWTRTIIGPSTAQRFRFLFERRWASRCVAEATRRHEERPYDGILAFGGFAQLVAISMRQNLGLPFIAVWNDPFPPYCAPAPYGHGKSYRDVPRAYRRLMQQSAQTASAHVFPSARLRDYMLDLLPGISAGQAVVLPHIASRRAHGEGTDPAVLTITHAGSLLPQRPITPFFQAVALARSALRPDFPLQLRFIGPQGTELAAIARTTGVADICDFSPEVPNTESFRILSESDVVLVVEAIMPESIFLPYKFVEAVETGRPIFAVTPNQGVISDSMQQHGGGWVVPGSSVEQIADALVAVCRAWERGELVRSSSDPLRSEFDEEPVARGYSALLHHTFHAPEKSGCRTAEVTQC